MQDGAICQTGEGKAPDLPCELKYLFTNYGPMDEYIPHDCFKPLNGVKRIVEGLTKPGDVVLDSFLGSGTTALACHLTGRDWLGTEMWPPYCRVAQERLALADRGISPYIGRIVENGKKTYYRRDGSTV